MWQERKVSVWWQSQEKFHTEAKQGYAIFYSQQGPRENEKHIYRSNLKASEKEIPLYYSGKRMPTSHRSHKPMHTQTHPSDKTLTEASATTCCPWLYTLEPRIWASPVNHEIPNRRLPSTQCWGFIRKGLCDLGHNTKAFLMATDDLERHLLIGSHDGVDSTD